MRSIVRFCQRCGIVERPDMERVDGRLHCGNCGEGTQRMWLNPA